MIAFDTKQKLHKNVRDLGKLFVAKGFKNVPKVQKIAQSGHTDNNNCLPNVNSCLIFTFEKCI